MWVPWLITITEAIVIIIFMALSWRDMQKRRITNGQFTNDVKQLRKLQKKFRYSDPDTLQQINKYERIVDAHINKLTDNK